MMKPVRFATRLSLLAVAASVSLFAGCSDEGPAGPDIDGAATMRVELTDAPAPGELFARAEVEIGAVEAVPADGPPIVLAEAAGTFDLLTLQDGATALLAAAEVEPGAYNQLRFEVLSAEVELAGDYTFADGGTVRELQVPSGKIRVNLRPLAGGADLEAEEGSELGLVLDMDVGRNFVLQGNLDTPAGLQGVLFTPVVRVAASGGTESDAGTISGTVTAPEGVELAGLEVRAEPMGSSGELTEDQTEAASARLSADGSYTIHHVAPGTYAVSLVEPPEGYDASPASRDATVGDGESATGVDFELVASGSASRGSGTLTLQLTDAPSDLFSRAVVWIGAVEAVPVDGPPVVMSEEGGEFDLLTLRDGVTATLASLSVEATSYEQVRFVVDSAEVGLADGLTFSNGDTAQSLQVPSGKLRLNLGSEEGEEEDAGSDEESGSEDVEVEEGAETTLVLDFDVDRSFVLQGNPDTPAGLKGVLLKPVLRVVDAEGAGAISGLVSAPDSVPVGGLTVTAAPVAAPDSADAGDGGDSAELGAEEDEQTGTATGTTDETGAYTVHFLAPGDYRVTVEAPEGYAAEPPEAVVTVGESETVAGVDFTLAPSAGG